MVFSHVLWNNIDNLSILGTKDIVLRIESFLRMHKYFFGASLFELSQQVT